MDEYFFKGSLSIALPSEALLNKKRSLKLHFFDPKTERVVQVDDPEVVVVVVVVVVDGAGGCSEPLKGGSDLVRLLLDEDKPEVLLSRPLSLLTVGCLNCLSCSGCCCSVFSCSTGLIMVKLWWNMCSAETGWNSPLTSKAKSPSNKLLVDLGTPGFSSQAKGTLARE